MNAYSVLGITESASSIEVKNAWRKMSQKWHPDRNKTKGAEGKYKIVQEAYEFIKSGQSMTGLFGNNKPNIKPKPKPKPETTSYHNTPFVITKLVVNCTFSEVFNGGTYNVPNSYLVAKIPIGVYSGLIERQKVFSRDLSESMVFDIQYIVADLSGFYYTDYFESKLHLFCEYQASVAAILAEQEVYIRNANPNIPDISFKLSASTFVKIDHAGLPIAGGRMPLYVNVKPVYSSIANTRDDTLFVLRKKIDDRLNRNRNENNSRYD